MTKKVVIRHPVGEGMAELDIYVTVGLYEDGQVGELFMKAGKMGGTVSGLLDAVGICMSLGLQHGVPLEMFTSKLKGMKFEPEGGTNDKDIRHAHSMIDAVMRWMEKKFLMPPEPVQEPPPQADVKVPFPDVVSASTLRPFEQPGLVMKTSMAPLPAAPEPPVVAAPAPLPMEPASPPVEPEKKSKLKMHRKRKPARRPA